MPLSKRLKNIYFLASLSVFVIWELETGMSVEEDGRRERGGGRMMWSTYESTASVTGTVAGRVEFVFS